MEKLIYAADDDANICEILKTFLEDAGYRVKVFSTGDALFEEFVKTPSDLVVLDIMMPGNDGIIICKKLREISHIPIILLTAKDSDLDYILGINSGGDDYLIKPFRPSILITKIKSIFRRMDMERSRHGEYEDKAVSFADLYYELKHHGIFCNKKNLGLTATELSLLKYMIQSAGSAISRDELLNKIWGINAEVETRAADETVSRIRQKMRNVKSKAIISTIWGFGYKLEVKE